MSQSTWSVLLRLIDFGLRDYGVAGQIGLEPSPEEYVADLVTVFCEVRRVLRDDGTVWLVLGDSYAGSGRGLNGDGTPGKAGAKNRTNRGTQVGVYTEVDAGLKPKDLMMIPARVAIALQSAGWYLRSDTIWAKGLSFCESYAGSCMPESVTDRPTSAHEHVFLLTKNATYFYDNEAVREPSTGQTGNAADFRRDTKEHLLPGQAHTQHRLDRMPTEDNGTRNLRDVWAINPAGYRGAHFATMPTALVEPCIKAGTSERGCCPACGAPWKRVVDRVALGERDDTGRTHGGAEQRMGKAAPPERGWEATHSTVGWTPTCGCDAGEPVPCVVLDPFSGAGTVGLVADRLGRHYIGCDISQEYNRMARERITADAPLFAKL
jgi:DNA modification methylase